MNSVLQLLFGLHELITDMNQSQWQEEHIDHCRIIRTFLDLTRLRQQAKQAEINSAVVKFSGMLRALDSAYISNDQQDASEFISRLLGMFQDTAVSQEKDPVSKNIAFILEEIYSCEL